MTPTTFSEARAAVAAAFSRLWTDQGLPYAVADYGAHDAQDWYVPQGDPDVLAGRTQGPDDGMAQVAPMVDKATGVARLVRYLEGDTLDRIAAMDRVGDWPT